MQSGPCKVSEQVLRRGVRILKIENDRLAATILPDKGADIYQLIYKPRDLDVMWKSPWGLKEPGRGVTSAFDSSVVWLEAYAGGWQEIFPSGGGPCVYKGVELNFHGEASMAAWDYEIAETGHDAAEVELSTRLFRSPFRIERRMRVEAGKASLILREKITNEGGETMEYMWGHHPAYGAPFIDESCRIDIGTHSLRADDAYAGTANPLKVNERYAWPKAERDGQITDLSRVPGQAVPRDTLAYFENFEAGWYGITNTNLGVGVGLVWPREIFPFAWFWQEMHASAGFPWYKSVYVMAIEPFTSIPGQGLVNVIDKTGTQRTLKPGESVQAELRAVFYESKTGIQRIEPDGTALLRKE
jgi:galactose mutarotase-like enzyme